MDIKQIQELVKIINKTNISEISIEEQDLKITIKQKEEVVQTYMSSTTTSPSVYAAAADGRSFCSPALCKRRGS